LFAIFHLNFLHAFLKTICKILQSAACNNVELIMMKTMLRASKRLYRCCINY